MRIRSSGVAICSIFTSHYVYYRKNHSESYREFIAIDSIKVFFFTVSQLTECFSWRCGSRKHIALNVNISFQFDSIILIEFQNNSLSTVPLNCESNSILYIYTIYIHVITWKSTSSMLSVYVSMFDGSCGSDAQQIQNGNFTVKAHAQQYRRFVSGCDFHDQCQYSCVYMCFFMFVFYIGILHVYGHI